MYSLLVDTHDSKVCFVLYKDGTVKDKIITETRMKHSETAMPSFSELIHRNNLKPQDISELLVVIGPGSFTGVRIGVVISKTLAYVLNIPIKCLTSIDLSVFSSESYMPGDYYIEEKNGYFVGNYDSKRKLVGDIKYYSKNDYTPDKAVLNENINFDNVYKYSKDIKCINPHLVNPLYIKQIEALK